MGGQWPEMLALCLRGVMLVLHANLKGIVHLNIIFSYMKVNQIYNLDHPVY